MTDLDKKKCVPCEGGLDPLSKNEAEKLLSKLDSEWKLGDDFKFIEKILATFFLVDVQRPMQNMSEFHSRRLF